MLNYYVLYFLLFYNNSSHFVNANPTQESQQMHPKNSPLSQKKNLLKTQQV